MKKKQTIYEKAIHGFNLEHFGKYKIVHNKVIGWYVINVNTNEVVEAQSVKARGNTNQILHLLFDFYIKIGG